MAKPSITALPKKITFHNTELAASLRPDAADSPSKEELAAVKDLLEKHGTLDVMPGFVKSGLFSAAVLTAGLAEENTLGYSNAWTRDNALVATCLLAIGKEVEAPRRVALGLAEFYTKHEAKLDAIIAGTADIKDKMQRPHIRFNATTLEENAEVWMHKQNDAIGYFMWLFAKLAQNGTINPTSQQLDLLGKFLRFFDKIQYWEDEDSGHWEEAEKVQASSVGAALAGIRQTRTLLRMVNGQPKPIEGQPPLDEVIARLEERGAEALKKILPNESIQDDKVMQSNAALLFLMHPLEVVEPDVQNEILVRTFEQLVGDYGIKRYRGDSYWHQDWLELPAEEREREQDERDKAVEKGAEAQWCLFDTVVSIIFGKAFRKSGDPQDLELQRYFLRRSLGQVTGEDCRLGAWKLPESYHRWRGEYVPNDVCPLLWAQANLAEAVLELEKSLAQ